MIAEAIGFLLRNLPAVLFVTQSLSRQFVGGGQY
jgi:hypothetical protein